MLRKSETCVDKKEYFSILMELKLLEKYLSMRGAGEHKTMFTFGVTGAKAQCKAGLALALGNSFGGYLGAHFTITRGESLIRLVLNLVLVLFIIKLLLPS